MLSDREYMLHSNYGNNIRDAIYLAYQKYDNAFTADQVFELLDTTCFIDTITNDNLRNILLDYSMHGVISHTFSISVGGIMDKAAYPQDFVNGRHVKKGDKK